MNGEDKQRGLLYVVDLWDRSKATELLFWGTKAELEQVKAELKRAVGKTLLLANILYKAVELFG